MNRIVHMLYERSNFAASVTNQDTHWSWAVSGNDGERFACGIAEDMQEALAGADSAIDQMIEGNS